MLFLANFRVPQTGDPVSPGPSHRCRYGRVQLQSGPGFQDGLGGAAVTVEGGGRMSRVTAHRADSCQCHGALVCHLHTCPSFWNPTAQRPPSPLQAASKGPYPAPGDLRKVESQSPGVAVDRGKAQIISAFRQLRSLFMYQKSTDLLKISSSYVIHKLYRASSSNIFTQPTLIKCRCQAVCRCWTEYSLGFFQEFTAWDLLQAVLCHFIKLMGDWKRKICSVSNCSRRVKQY